MNKQLLAILAGCACQLLAMAAEARSSNDGQWNITFATQSGDCNPTYNVSVNIENGAITAPNAETFRGTVTSSGAVGASVAVQEKHASGSGKLTGDRIIGVIDGRPQIASHGSRDMPIWGDRYAITAAEHFAGSPYDQEAFIRGRVLILVAYLSRIQQK